MWIDKQKTINLQLEMPVRLSTYRKGNAIPPLPGTNIFHSTELFHVFEMTRGYEPLLIVAYIGNRPVGKLLAVIRKSVRLFPPAIIKRCEIYGTGEYFDEEQNKEDLFGEILEHLTNEVLCKSFLIEFRNLENPLFGYKAFRKNNYFAINWLRVRNSLHSKAPYERLSMSRRRQINKALRNGAIMEIADNEKDIQDFSRMLKKAYSSQIRKHFPDIGFFRLLAWQNPEKELAKVFLVKYKGKIIVTVDDGGVGGGVVDRLRRICKADPQTYGRMKVVPVKFGMRIRHRYYYDTTTYMMSVVKELLSDTDKNGEAKSIELVLPKDDDLIAQLSCRKYTMTESSVIKIESKKEMKARGLPSPDEADCVLLLCLPIKKD